LSYQQILFSSNLSSKKNLSSISFLFSISFSFSNDFSHIVTISEHHLNNHHQLTGTIMDMQLQTISGIVKKIVIIPQDHVILLYWREYQQRIKQQYPYTFSSEVSIISKCAAEEWAKARIGKRATYEVISKLHLLSKIGNGIDSTKIKLIKNRI